MGDIIRRYAAPEETKVVDGLEVVNLDALLRMALSTDAKAPTAQKVEFLRQVRSRVAANDADRAKVDSAIKRLEDDD